MKLKIGQKNILGIFGLVEIEKLLNKNGKSLKDFEGLPQPNIEEKRHLDNRLIRKQLIYDVNQLRIQHDQWKSSLHQS